MVGPRLWWSLDDGGIMFTNPPGFLFFFFFLHLAAGGGHHTGPAGSAAPAPGPRLWLCLTEAPLKGTNICDSWPQILASMFFFKTVVRKSLLFAFFTPPIVWQLTLSYDKPRFGLRFFSHFFAVWKRLLAVEFRFKLLKNGIWIFGTFLNAFWHIPSWKTIFQYF